MVGFAIVAVTVANMLRNPETEPFSLEQFMPQSMYDLQKQADAKLEEPPPPTEAMIETVELISSALGGLDNRKGRQL